MPVYINTVAVIDDDDISLLLITKLLQQKQVAKTILNFSNGLDALTFFKNNVSNSAKLPSVILLDISMPGMNGWQLLEELNKIEFTGGYVPAVCMISAAIIDFGILKNYPFVKGFLIKPIMFNKLLDLIETIMANREEANRVEA